MCLRDVKTNDTEVIEACQDRHINVPTKKNCKTGAVPLSAITLMKAGLSSTISNYSSVTTSADSCSHIRNTTADSGQGIISIFGMNIRARESLPVSTLHQCSCRGRVAVKFAPRSGNMLNLGVGKTLGAGRM